MHVVKRLALMVVGYFVAVFVALVAGALGYGALGAIPGAPDHFDLIGVSPILMFAVPTVGLFVLTLAYVLTALQALVTTLLSEIFALRSVFVHAAFGAIVAVSGLVLIGPLSEMGIGGGETAATGMAAFSGVAGGIVYWLIAGRNAGFRAPKPLVALSPAGPAPTLLP